MPALDDELTTVAAAHDIALPRALPETLVVGAGGFLGTRFLKAYERVQADCAGTCRNAEGPLQLDLSTPEGFFAEVETQRWSWALLLAGVTSIAACEADPAATRAVNVEGTLRLARRCLDRGQSLVYFSSDYVFPGEGAPFAETSATAPRTEYGRQKVEVESRLLELAPGNVLVVRLSKVYSLERGSGTLLDALAGSLARAEPVRAAWDQRFCPTLVDDVIATVAALQCAKASGVVHVASPEPWSRYDLALCMARALGVREQLVERVALGELNLAGDRPRDTTLRCDRLASLTQARFLPLRDAVDSVAGAWRSEA